MFFFFYQNPLAIDKLIFRLEQAFPILNHWLLEVVEQAVGGGFVLSQLHRPLAESV